MANPLEVLCNDEVRLQSKAGLRSGPYMCSMDGNKSAHIFEESLAVAEGDTLLRTLPDGGEESFTIVEVEYSRGLHAIPPSYTLHLQKDTSLVARQPPPSTTTVHISNSQGIQIGDYNSQQFMVALKSLVTEIDAADAKPEEKEEAKSRLQRFLSHPLVVRVAGPIAQALLGA